VVYPAMEEEMRRWITLIVVIIVVVGAFLGFRRFRENQDQQIQAGLETYKAERGTLTATIGASGSVEANQSDTIAFQTTGIVKTVFVEQGDEVKKGQVFRRKSSWLELIWHLQKRLLMHYMIQIKH
jgi:multidrug efflux pump subunit AcrA (membrane-fusion protein)